MKTMIAKVLPIGLLALIMTVMMAPSSAFADDPTNATTTITSDGTLAVTDAAIEFGIVALGADADVTEASDAATWNVSNTLNQDKAIQVSLAATDFTDVTGNYSISADGFKVKVQQSSIVANSIATSGDAPSTQVLDYQVMNGVAAQIILSSTGMAYPAGMGVYDFAPEFQLLIPGLTTVIGEYTSTVTVTTATGPR